MNISNTPKTMYAGTKLGKLSCYEEVVNTVAEPNTSINNRRLIEENAKNSENITKTEKQQLLQVLFKFPNLYSTAENITGRTNMITHTIDTGNAPPIRRLPFRTAPKEKEIIAKELVALLEKSIIRPSTSAWSTNIVLVRKSNGKHRVCIDFRALNNITKRNAYTIPRVDDLLDTMKGAKFFSVLDQSNAYYAIPVAENDKEKTAFNSSIGLFEFNYLPFGLTNAPGSFQILMDIVLAGLNWQQCLVYLDDVLVFAQTHDGMPKRLEMVLQKLNDAGLKLKLYVCKFSQQEVTYLGHVISADKIKPDETKLEAIKCIEEPKNTKELKSFLGLISYYRKYIRGCAQIAQPLTKLLKKDHKFQWNNEHKSAFNNLKQKLLENPILAHPDFSKQFILQTDASLDGIGAVLSQMHDSSEHTVAYASRTLKLAEKRYPITELETLSVVEFVKYFRPYLYLNDVIVQTDHNAVKAVSEKPNPSARISSWGLALAGTNLNIQPRKGSAHGNADALSRLPNKQAKPCFDIENVSYSRPQESINCNFPQLLDIHKSQQTELTDILKEIDDDPEQTKYEIIHDLVYRNTNNDWKLVVPPSLCNIVISAYHDDPLSGHFSARKTSKSFRKNMCQIKKPSRHKIKATLKPISVNKPFEILAVDFMGPLPLRRNGNIFIVVFIDYFSKYIESFATNDITAETIAKLFVTRIICRHGAPEILQSDRGSDFTGN